MKMLELHRRVGAVILAVALGGCGDDDGPVPDVVHCTDEAATHACIVDRQHAGTYPALDAIAEAARTTGDDPSRFALGCGYGVSLDGEILYLGSTGYVDNGTHRAECKPDRFGNVSEACRWGLHHVAGVASVSKTLTAIAVLRLFEDGVLEGDPTTVTLADVLPEVPEALADLTLHQLLAHTSGLDEPEYADGFTTAEGLAERFPELQRPGLHPRAMWYGLKGEITPDPTLVDEANQVGNYSNAAYRILGAVVDAHRLVDGGDLELAVVQPQLLDRAELTRAYDGGYETTVRRHVASPYYPYDDRLSTACQHSPGRAAALDAFVPGFVWSPPDDGIYLVWKAAHFKPGASIDSLGRRGPSGGWMMTIGDVLRLGLGIENRQFVSEETFQRMRPVVASDRGFDFGYGLIDLPRDFTADPSGAMHPGYGHAGNLDDAGYSAMWRIVELPGGRSVGAAMLCNGNLAGMTGVLGRMMDQVYTDFVAGAGPSPITPDQDAAFCPPVDEVNPIPPSMQLTVDFGDTLQSTWRSYLFRTDGDAATAEALLRRELALEPEGPAILDAWKRGDVERAAEGMLDLMERRLRSAPATTTGTGSTSTTSTGSTSATSTGSTSATSTTSTGSTITSTSTTSTTSTSTTK